MESDSKVAVHRHVPGGALDLRMPHSCCSYGCTRTFESPCTNYQHRTRNLEPYDAVHSSDLRIKFILLDDFRPVNFFCVACEDVNEANRANAS